MLPKAAATVKYLRDLVAVFRSPNILARLLWPHFSAALGANMPAC